MTRAAHDGRCAPRRRVHDRRHPWSDTWWPRATGVLTAASLLGIDRAFGGVSMVFLPLTLWAVLTVVISLSVAEDGVRVLTAAEWGAWATVGLVVLLGLPALVASWWWLPAAAVALTSPPALHALRTWQHRFVHASPERVRRRAVDTRFARIIADLDHGTSS